MVGVAQSTVSQWERGATRNENINEHDDISNANLSNANTDQRISVRKADRARWTREKESSR
jgi:hypothetical protein